MNLFKMHMESATEGVELPEGVQITGNDDGNTVEAAILQATQEEVGLEQDQEGTDGLIEDGESLEELSEVVNDVAPKTEHRGLTPKNARLAKMALARIVGAQYAEQKFPRFENFNSSADAEASNKYVQEAVGEGLKRFWEALKAQFVKAWTRIKTWYIGNFSTAKKIADKARTVRNRAENLTGSIDKQTFEFSQAALISVGGRAKDVNAFTTALKAVANVIETADDATGEGSEAAGDVVEKVSKTEPSLSALKDMMAKMTGAFASAYSETYKDSAALGADVKATASPVLPGDTRQVIVIPNDTSDTNRVLRVFKILMIKDSKVKEVPKEVTTLNAGQIIDITEIVAQQSEDIHGFEKSFAKVDKEQARVLKGIDDLVKAIEAGEDEKAKTASRETASALTGFVQRIGKVAGTSHAYASKVHAAALNYCEASMSNHKTA